MTQRFTYFRRDGTREVRVQPSGPLPEAGEVWVRGTLEPHVQPDPLEVRVGESGVKVWMAIHWLRLVGGDPDAVVRGYGGIVSRADIEGAMWLYDASDYNRRAIDERIEQEKQPA